MKFVSSRPYADPEAAARKLLDIVRASITASGLPHACSGATNTAFTQAGGSLQEYGASRDYAQAKLWFRIDRSGTRFELLPDGSE